MIRKDPWYRNPWPWLLMAGPAIVVVASLVTLVLAIESFDGFAVDPKSYKHPIMQEKPAGD